MNYTNYDIVLSDNAVAYTLETGTPLITMDFVGYVGILDPQKDKILYLVDINGKFELVSGDKTRPKLPKKLKRKWMKWCLKNKFLVYLIEPFPEFSRSYSLPFCIERAKVLPILLISAVEYYKGAKKHDSC